MKTTKTTNMKVRKILAMVLAIAMVASLLPIMAAAATGTLDDGRYTFTSGADAMTAVPAEMVRGDADQAGRVWTTRNVVDNGDGTFTVTLLAVGLKYDGDKLPLEAGSSLVIKDEFNGNDFAISNAGGLAVSGSNVTWTIPAANLSTDASAPSSISYTLTLTTIEAGGPYVTNPKAAVATFRVTDDNPYYWSKEEKDTVNKYSANINWNNGTTSQLREVVLTGAGLNVTFDGRDGYDWIAKSDFDKLTLATYPSKNFFTSEISGTGTTKTFTFWFVVYRAPGVYEIYNGIVQKVGNNGGNTNYPDAFEKTTVYIDWNPVHGNDGEGNVSHSDLVNKGQIELAYAIYNGVVNHNYKIITIDENGDINVPANYELGFSDTFKGKLGEEYTAALRLVGPYSYEYEFEADKSSASSLNISADESKNVIDLFYIITVDLRAEATVKVIHEYTTNFWKLEDGRYVEASSKHTVPGYDSVKAGAEWKATESFTAAKRARGFEFTGAITTAPGGLTDNGGSVTITLAGGQNIITLSYVKDIDNRVPVNVIVNHHYTKAIMTIEDGKAVVSYDPDDATVSEPFSGYYVGETFTPAEVNNYNGEDYDSADGNAAKLIGYELTENGLVINLYYSLEDMLAMTGVTVNHHYYTIEMVLGEEGEDPYYDYDNPVYDSTSIESFPQGNNVMYVGEDFIATLKGNGYTYNASKSDNLKITLAANGNEINIVYEKLADNREAASINVTHKYVTNLETIVRGSVRTITVNNGYAVPNGDDSYEGKEGDTFTPAARYEFEGEKYTLKSGSLDMVRLEEGTNPTIELVYERDDSDLVEGNLEANYVYETYFMTVNENGVAGYYSEPVNELTKDTWSPEDDVYVGQIIRNIPDGAEEGYTAAGTNPSTTHRIRSEAEKNVLTFVYTKHIPLPTADVEVNHNYKTYEMQIVEGAPEYVLVDEIDLDPSITATKYVGETYTADRLDNGFNYLGAESDNESFDENALTITVAAEGNVINLSYETRTNPLARARYTINHIYVSIDFDGTETIETGLNHSTRNRGYEGMIVTATLNTISDAFAIAENRSSATNGFAEDYGFPTIELAAGDENVINLVYTRDIDTRIATSVTVNHIYSTEYRTNNVFNRLEEDGTFSETFTSFEDGIWVGKEFTAKLIEMFNDTEYGYDSKDASPDFIAEDSEEGLCLTISLDRESNTINISYLRVVNNNITISRNYRVTVNFIDKDTGEALMAAKVGASQPEGTRYAESIPSISGYSFDSRTGDELEGILNSNKVINLYYVKDAEIIIPDEPLTAIEIEPDVIEEIEEEEIPLTVFEPEEEVNDDLDIIDEEPPLAELPQTGVSPFAIPLVVFGLGMLGLGVVIKRPRKDGNVTEVEDDK